LGKELGRNPTGMISHIICNGELKQCADQANGKLGQP